MIHRQSRTCLLLSGNGVVVGLRLIRAWSADDLSDIFGTILSILKFRAEVICIQKSVRIEIPLMKVMRQIVHHISDVTFVLG